VQRCRHPIARRRRSRAPRHRYRALRRDSALRRHLPSRISRHPISLDRHS
jgi:hypothetical protein